MSTVLTAQGLGKKYGRKWALSDCTLEVPAGRVVGLVGPNGAGKSTFLNLAVGMLTPSAGEIEVLGARPPAAAPSARRSATSARTPDVRRAERGGPPAPRRPPEPGWDAALADDRIERLGLDPEQRAGRLSGGQRAQLALTLGIAKRPELLLLDEPVASLDPLARREFLQDLMEAVAEQELSVVLSSHLVSDVERACDYLVVLVDSRVQVAGDIEHLLATHHRLTGPRRDEATLPTDQDRHLREPHRPAVDVPRPHRGADPRPGLGGRPADPRGPRPGLHGPFRAEGNAKRGPDRAWRHFDDLADLAQFRASAALVLGALALAAVVLAITGPRLADLLRVSGENFFTELAGRHEEGGLHARDALAYVVPAVVGVFWGAPMVARELEAGTYRLVWNQSITRTRWLVAKLGVAGVGAWSRASAAWR